MKRTQKWRLAGKVTLKDTTAESREEIETAKQSFPSRNSKSRAFRNILRGDMGEIDFFILF